MAMGNGHIIYTSTLNNKEVKRENASERYFLFLLQSLVFTL